MTVVADAGPLIHLSAIGQLDLLPKMFRRVVVPDVVRAEVLAGHGLPGADELNAASWVDVASTAHLATQIRALRPSLDAGERAAIAVAVERDADLFVCDDRLGRREAVAQGLRVLGTLGVLVRGKQLGHLESVAPCIEALQAAGFRATDALVTAILQAAGEAQ